jgi:probable phosphoglycerate mutase
MRRAQETATLSGLGAHALVDDDLVEMDYGDDEGRTTEEIGRTQPGWTVWDGCTGGETPVQVGARVDRVLARATAVDGLVVIFGHGHCLRVLVARWLGFPPIAGRRFALATGTWSVLGYEHEARVLERLNVSARDDA